MTRGMFTRLIAPFASASLAFALLAGTALANDTANTLDDQLQLNTAITVSGPDVTLGDIFTGYLTRPEKVVAQATRPGQRLTLSSAWLSKLAHTYGLGWQPTNGYDRAVVYQPGQAVSVQEIIAAVKAELIAKGMPSNYSVLPAGTLPTMTVSMNTTTTIGVREAFFDAQQKSFSAVVEIPPGTPEAQFVSFRGQAFPVVTVPVLKESAAKTAVITSAMITTMDLPEEQMRADTITDAAMLIGKTPKAFLKAGLPIRETEISQATLVEVPVLTTDIRRDGTISESAITFATFNAGDLPADVITDAHQLVGRTPRRFLAAGAPMRRGDVQMVRQVQVPVVARDINRGETIDAKDITYVSMNDTDVVANVLMDEEAIVGRLTKHPIRAGQTLRGFDIFRPTAVERGKLVTIVWSTAAMNLTAQGLAQQPGGIGDVIRVTNSKSKTSVLAEVIDAQTVRVASQEAASR